MRALLIDEGIDRASLVAGRALARAGWEVGAAAPTRGPSLAARSASVARFHPLPALTDDPAPFVEGVRAAISAGGYEVVFPAWESAVLALSAERDRLGATLPYASHEVLVRSFDMLAILQAAQRAGIAIPRTEVASPEALAAWQGPLALKPATHFCGARLFDDAAAAVEAAAAIAAAGATPLAQERIDGKLLAFATVADRDGRLVSVSQQIAQRVWPAGVGVTARGVTVAIDPQLRDAVGAMLGELGWFGLVQLQFLLAGDTPKMIDFNGRWYGSLALAIRAGADHPDTWGRLALNLPAMPSQARAGLRYQWLTRDLRASFALGGVGALVQAAAITPRAAHSLWSPREPLLAPWFFAAQARRAARRRAGPRALRRRALALIEHLLSTCARLRPLRWLLHRRALRARRDARRILFVCYGNLNRSAFAAALASREWPDQEISQAGDHAIDGAPTAQIGCAVAGEWGIDLRAHRATALTARAIRDADAIFIFDARNLATVLGRFPRTFPRLHLIGALSSRGALTIADPHGGTPADYRDAFGQVASLI